MEKKLVKHFAEKSWDVFKDALCNIPQKCHVPKLIFNPDFFFWTGPLWRKIHMPSISISLYSSYIHLPLAVLKLRVSHSLCQLQPTENSRNVPAKKETSNRNVLTIIKFNIRYTQIYFVIRLITTLVNWGPYVKPRNHAYKQLNWSTIELGAASGSDLHHSLTTKVYIQAKKLEIKKAWK